MKHAGQFLLVILIALFASSSAKSAQYGDMATYYESFTTIFSKHVYNNTLTGKESKHYLRFPEEPAINCDMIVGLWAFDNNRNNIDANGNIVPTNDTAVIIDGGLGKRHITVEFTWAGLEPLDFEVYIYGVRDEADLNVLHYIN